MNGCKLAEIRYFVYTLVEQLYWPVVKSVASNRPILGNLAGPLWEFSLAPHIGQEFANMYPISGHKQTNFVPWYSPQWLYFVIVYKCAPCSAVHSPLNGQFRAVKLLVIEYNNIRLLGNFSSIQMYFNFSSTSAR